MFERTQFLHRILREANCIPKCGYSRCREKLLLSFVEDCSNLFGSPEASIFQLTSKILTWRCCNVTEGGYSHGSISGTSIGDPSLPGYNTRAQKTWNVFNGLGDMAFAYSFSLILIEIQVLDMPILLLYCDRAG
jgi:hypothetical protein